VTFFTRRLRGTLLSCIPLIGCLTGDFGRVRPSLVQDDMHAWLGKEAAATAGIVPSEFPLTDSERLLRDLAYPLIAPPYDRAGWDEVLAEYGLRRRLRRDLVPARENYTAALFVEPVHSTSSLYARLNDDIRNDVERIGPFYATARTVIDLDRKREKSLAFISDPIPWEFANAARRVRENALVVQWTQNALHERVAAYRFALERLVITAPSAQAVAVERSLTLLKTRIAQLPQLPVVEIVFPRPVTAGAQRRLVTKD
jgi:hypothetical protein